MKKYLIDIGIGFFITIIILFSRGIFEAKALSDFMKIFSDAFFASGILILGVGLLRFCSQNGAFDGLSYSFRLFVNPFLPKSKRLNASTFYEYKLNKRSKGRKFLDLIYVGCGFILMGIIFTILFSYI